MSSKPPTMPKRSLCADNLFLLGELLQGAAEYLSRCQEALEDEQGQMVELACEQIPQLEQMVETLDRKLKELEGHLRKRVAPRASEQPGATSRTGPRPRNARDRAGNRREIAQRVVASDAVLLSFT